ncbi:MAG TPA: family 1 encapsulin nanocompartment shell protein [Solirubrobacteraceae bacterium]|nr:family 1 encapsulin nanocompartment shell protein [Solirubrobacteraceae bacterium]
MNHLLRSLAPISDRTWELLDNEARERLAPALAARKLVDFSGPFGWEYSATNLGRVELSGWPAEGVAARQRKVLPVIELRAEFTLAAAELADADRGADDVDLEPLDRAAHQIALGENAAVLNGVDGAITGIAEATPHDRISLGENPEGYPREVTAAVDRLLSSGVAGPYALALGPDPYKKVVQTAEHGGYPLVEHLHKIIDGPVVWTPGLSGGVLVSLRGGDFTLHSGQDLSVGYDSHDRDGVRLYLEESFSFHVATPEAAVVLGQ